MRSEDRQPDLFAEPPPPPAARRFRHPPYSLAELEALDRQLRGFERLPDEWCAGWWDIYDRAHDTLRQVPNEQRPALRAVFFEQAERLLSVERAADLEAAAAEATQQPKTRRPKVKSAKV